MFNIIYRKHGKKYVRKQTAIAKPFEQVEKTSCYIQNLEVHRVGSMVGEVVFRHAFL
jgi:hypothetical protein